MFGFIISIFFLNSYFSVDAVSTKIIIDTDGAADDLRAVCMLSANPKFEILGITSSEGALMPENITRKLYSLLTNLNMPEIPIGTGRNLHIQEPAWRKQSEAVFWGDTLVTYNQKTDAKSLVTSILKGADNEVIFICLGGLTNLHDVLKEYPVLQKNIKKILWYNDNEFSGVNYDIDRESADWIMQSGIKLDIISGLTNTFTIGDGYINMLSSVDSPYAERIVESHRHGQLASAVKNNHLQAWDDLVALYLFAPDMFNESQKVSTDVSVYSLKDELAIEQVKLKIIQLLYSRDKSMSE